MSLKSSIGLLPDVSHWHWNVSPGFNKFIKFSCVKKSVSDEKSEGNSLLGSKINCIIIYLLSEKNHQSIEVHARTANLDTYFKIVDVAQNYFSNKSKYYFNSTYDHFPKDKDGLCTIEAVKDRQSKWKNGLFERTHLESFLAYRSRYETTEERSKQLTHALNILQGADNTVGEIAKLLELLLKV